MRWSVSPTATWLAVRGNRPGKPVQLQEYEIKYLCTKAREIFINQPILLELEAPIKICGAPLFLSYACACLTASIARAIRRYTWPVLRSAAAFRVRRVPPRSQLPLLGGLRRPWQAIARDHLSATGVQNQVPRELLCAEGEPRVCKYQSNLWIL